MCIEKTREELHECISKYGTSDTRTIEKSQELDKEIEIEQLKRETVYYMKRSVQAERFLKENECFCPVLQRNEIRDFLRS
jgi:predicted  nucleic acid-binding Zn ribbon protein